MRRAWLTVALLLLAQQAAATYYAFAGGSFSFQTSAQIAVPDVTALNATTADTALEAEGLDTGATTTRCSSEAADEVVSQNPVAGVLVQAGATVDLVLSTGAACPPGASKKLRLGMGLGL